MTSHHLGAVPVSVYAPGRMRVPLPLQVGVLTGAKLVLNTAQRFVYPFLPALARGLGISLEQAGFLVSAGWIAGLGAPGVVRVAARFRAANLLVYIGLVSFVLGAVVTAWFGTFVAAVVGFVAMGIAKPAYSAASQAYVSDRVPYSRRARYLGVLELTWAGGLLIGAPLAGWLINIGSWRTPFWVLAIAAGIATLVLSQTLDRGGAGAPRDPGRLWSGGGLPLLVVMALLSAGSELVFVVMGAWFEESFGLTLLALGGVGVAIGLVELAAEGFNLGFTDRIGKRRAVAAGVVAASIAYLLLGVFESNLAGGLAVLLLGIAGFEFAFVAAIPLASEQQPQARTRYLAWFMVAAGVGRAGADLVGPGIFSRGGVAAIGVIAAAVTLTGLAILSMAVSDGPASNLVESETRRSPP